jgi:hypothetical protein
MCTMVTNCISRRQRDQETGNKRLEIKKFLTPNFCQVPATPCTVISECTRDSGQDAENSRAASFQIETTGNENRTGWLSGLRQKYAV